MEPNQVLEIALLAGQMLIGNGAEAYRVEETIERICKNYNLACECMVTANSVLVSIIYGKDEKVTSFKKVKTRHVDLYRVELINSFSREIQGKPVSYEKAKKMLKDIEAAPYFSFPLRLIAACMTSFIYALFFNGRIYEAIASAVISFVVYFIIEKISSLGFFQFFEFFFSGFFIGVVSLIFEKVFPFINKGNVITGAIMILIPGVALTNGIKDIIFDHFTSGMVKFCESMLVITALGAGIGAALKLGKDVFLW